jgi:hypothetical protein
MCMLVNEKSAVLWLHGLVQDSILLLEEIAPTQSGADPMACIEANFLSLFLIFTATILQLTMYLQFIRSPWIC